MRIVKIECVYCKESTDSIYELAQGLKHRHWCPALTYRDGLYEAERIDIYRE